MEKTNQSDLPQVAAEYIDSVIKHMKYRRKVRAEVREELIAHFTDALADCETDEEKQQAAKELIEEFGNIKLLGKLLRRAKKRCRPIWQQGMLAVLKVIGIIFLLLLLRVGYMATGRPTISVDYTQWLNDKVRDGRDKALNSYYDYQKAIELIPDEYPPEIQEIDEYAREQRKTPEDWIAIEAFLKSEAEAINAFRAGTAKPYYWNIYQPPKNEKDEMAGGVVENLMPQMSRYRKIALRMAVFQIPFDLHSGNNQQAINDSLAFCKFGQHLLSEGVLIEVLVGIAVDALARETVYDLLNQIDMSAEDLLHFQQVIEKNYDPHTALMDWEIEKAFWYDQIQHMFTDDGQGDGRPLPKGTILVASDWTDFIKGIIKGFPGRKEAVNGIEKIFAEAEKSKRLTPRMLHSEEYDLEELQRVIRSSGFLQKVGFPAIQETLSIGWRRRVDQAGLLGTLAILRFEKENERLPESWDELLEKKYLKIVPMDPYSDKPLVYKKTEDGFILYSVGLNFTDDGGLPGTDKNGKPQMWGENGDWIFWPVE